MTAHMTARADAVEAPRERTLLRIGAVSALVGTIAYIALTVIHVMHGDPPVLDTAKMLDHVAAHPEWRPARLANILAVLFWVGAFTALTSSHTRGTAWALGRVAHAVMIGASAVFAVYFSLHGFGLGVLAEDWASAGASERANILVEAEAVLTVLGSTAFTAQALLGLSFLLYGLTTAFSHSYPTWLGWVGAVAGAGWLAGALLVAFDVIIPFMMIACAWMLVMGVLMWRRAKSLPVADRTVGLDHRHGADAQYG